MDKLLLTIEVPSVEQIFDFTAPKTITPGLMRELLYPHLTYENKNFHIRHEFNAIYTGLFSNVFPVVIQ